MNGMAQTAQGTGVVFNTNVSSGALLSIKDASGSELISATAPKAANWVCLASDKLTSGATYTLYLNGKATATATAGTTTSGGGFGGGMGGNMGGRGGQMNGGSGEMPGNDQMPGNGQVTDNGEKTEKGQRSGDGTGRRGKNAEETAKPVILEGVGVMGTQLGGEAFRFMICY